ncbi:F-box only protein 15-like [Cyprinodon tularosa]|uniref:F-box only protein 15-like n=1 Tax=Cyprinodon tularosa TaxID=77115 RepID=UPI0018E217FA|nr:F-box only protein 15-like [Cyprinodon tularosa]
MAAGRGEFFRSLAEGFERKPAQQAPEIQQPRAGRGRPNLGGAFAAERTGFSAKWRKTQQKKASREGSGSGTETSDQPTCPGLQKKKFPEKSSVCKLNLLERLPYEILIKILSYLDPPSLFCVGHVSRLFNRLSNDDFLWHRIYMSKFNKRMWKPKCADTHTVTDNRAEPMEDGSISRWKKLYFNLMTGQEMKKWMKLLREISPSTGLPWQTVSVLRNLNVSWELTLCSHDGKEHRLEQSKGHFFESSMILCWSLGICLKFYQISSIRLHGIRMEPQGSSESRKSNWRSLILELATETLHLYIGTDKRMRVLLLQPSVIMGFWAECQEVAFIMVSLHFHKLVEKSLLGSKACPYFGTGELPPVVDSDPELGLHGYTLHLVLHNTSTMIMSGHFKQLSSPKDSQIQGGLVELRFIQRADLSQHRSLSGSIRIPWKNHEIEGAVENCCIMGLTLLDEFQLPFWCVSSPIYITMASRKPSSDYGGHEFQMVYRSPEGEVKMLLVWLQEQKQVFLIGLTAYISVAKLNKHFKREY